ncbi:CYTH domain-containing protein [Psychroflexus tropicus]|uniref:CYTH domain-containing protein n=1 Tax=Psychroflexus tropicus TaxID=197345 RepID=UPI00035CD4F7|nr:CYTH domain-containing protein [Psychroflexus tropicus]
MLEIERKFLVNSKDFKKQAFKQSKISQGFLNSDKMRTVRVRLTDEQGFLTIKGKSSASGTSRFEWEKEISTQEALDLLRLCEPGKILKTRYYVSVDKHTYEVDEFYGENEGLIIAEIELNSEDEHFTKPDWLGEEVTGQVKYYNAMLSRNSFTKW